MRVVAENMVRSAVSLSSAREAVHDAFVALHAGVTLAPPEFAMTFDNGGELHIKGAHLGGRWAAFKLATGQFPGGTNSGFTIVIDTETGVAEALLDDCGWLTEMRTAAAGAVAAKALARSDSKRVGLLGAGVQAGYQIEALRDVFDLESVNVWSRTRESAQRFASHHVSNAVATVSEAIADADIIVCCTPSSEPLLDLAQVGPGTHITAVGADNPSKRELADDLLAGCDVLVCDLVTVSSEVGELSHVPELRRRAVELGAVLAGDAPGRALDTDITVVDLCGLGIQDAAVANLVMANLPPEDPA